MKTQHLASSMVVLAALFACQSPEESDNAGTPANLSPSSDSAATSENDVRSTEADSSVTNDSTAPAEDEDASDEADSFASDNCAELSESECGPPLCFRITGTPIDADNYCYDSTRSSFLACMAIDLCCAALWYARDPEGNLWLFPDSCIPPNWTDDMVARSNAPDECSPQIACSGGCVGYAGTLIRSQ